MEGVEEIEKIAEEVTNIRYALKLPLPANMHLDQVNNYLQDWETRLRKIVVDETGENPWASHEEMRL